MMLANPDPQEIARKLGAEFTGHSYVFPPSRQSRAHENDEFVYFVGGESGCIKIGLSAVPEWRLGHLQVGSPIKLQIMAVCRGDRDLEKEYHHRFRDSWSHGEWFHRTPELMAEIAWLSEPNPTMTDKGE